ncbi:MAG: hypothetical protein AAFV43_03710 [Planctomycetota bacterium]
MTNAPAPTPNSRLARRQRRIVTGLALLSIAASFVVAGPVLKASGFYGCVDELWPVESVKVDDRYRVRTKTRLGPVARQARRFASGWERAAPLCCAVWVVFGPGNIIVRAAGVSACLAALACVASHRSADDSVGLYFGVLALYVPLLGGFKRFTGWRLVDTDLPTTDRSYARLGLAEMFVVTACLAMLATAIQAAIPWNQLPLDDLLFRLWRHLSSRVVWGHDAVYLLPAAAASLVILGRRRRGWLLAAAVMSAIVVTPIIREGILLLTTPSARVLIIYRELTLWNRLFLDSLAISCGFMSGTCFAAWVLRSAGFRLVSGDARIRLSQPTTTSESSDRQDRLPRIE